MTADAYTFSRLYGPGPFRQGVASDHVYLAERAGLEVRSTGRRSWIVDATGRTMPVLCSAIIEVWTEDGRSDGRCGAFAVDAGYCDAHAEEADAWAAASEAERIAWEKEVDAL